MRIIKDSFLNAMSVEYPRAEEMLNQ